MSPSVIHWHAGNTPAKPSAKPPTESPAFNSDQKRSPPISASSGSSQPVAAVGPGLTFTLSPNHTDSNSDPDYLASYDRKTKPERRDSLSCNSTPDTSRRGTTAETEPRQSCCRHIRLGAAVGGWTALRTFFIVSVSNTLAKLINIGLNIGWQRSESELAKAGIGIACAAVIAGSAFETGSRLSVLMSPCSRLSKRINFLAGNVPTIATCMLIMGHLDATTRGLTASKVTFIAVERILSRFSRDFMTMLSRGLVPSLTLRDDKNAELSATNKDRLHINVLKAAQATAVYFVLQLAYFYTKTSPQYLQLFGTDGESNDANGNLKDFEDMFHAAVPVLLMRTIIEMLDDVNGGVALAHAAYHQKDVVLSREPMNRQRVEKNFTDFTETVEHTRDATSLRIANSVASMALEILIPKGTNFKPVLQALWGGWTEMRSFIVEKGQRADHQYLREKGDVLDQGFMRRAKGEGSTDSELKTMIRRVSGKTKELQQRYKYVMVAGATDLGVGTSIPRMTRIERGSETDLKRAPILNRTDQSDDDNIRNIVTSAVTSAVASALGPLRISIDSVNNKMTALSPMGITPEAETPRSTAAIEPKNLFSDKSESSNNRLNVDDIKAKFNLMSANTMFKIRNEDYQLISFDMNTGIATVRSDNFVDPPRGDHITFNFRDGPTIQRMLFVDNR